MIKLHQLCVNAGDFLLRNISLDIAEDEYFILVGPTGSGKTVLLETIAGIRSARSGEIWFGDNILNPVSAERRGISLVYQDCALFPHLSVAENIVFGLRIRKENPVVIRTELQQIVELLGIGNLLSRKPETLSGGERHKVALARSVLVKPRLLLLDEPFSALDPETRENLRQELKNIHFRLGLAIIHVTHDFEEAMALGQRIAVLNNGQIEQVGTPEQIFRQPTSDMVAHFTQMRNIFTGQLIPGEGGFNWFKTEDLIITVYGDNMRATHACIRPDDISLYVEQPYDETVNMFRGRIARIMEAGPALQIVVQAPQEFHCLITRRDFMSQKLTEGHNVYITFRPETIHLF